jgi:asparagine synthase (glutamine-hydrolysing)
LSLTLRSDVPVGIALSGGLDSGGIAALAAPKYKDVLQAFSVGYADRPACDERAEAETLAQRLGLPFHDIELRTADLVEFFPQLIHLMDDPIADIAAYGHFAVMQLAADHGIKVMLSGIGGDELFWGYDWLIDAARLAEQKRSQQDARAGWFSDRFTSSPFYQRLRHSKKLPTMIQAVLRHQYDLSQMALHHPQQSVFYNVRADFQAAWSCRQRLYTPQFLEKLAERNPFSPFVVAPEMAQDVPAQMVQLLFETWLVSNCLALGDRTSMASSLEVRIPLLDHKLIELVLGLQKRYPDRQKFHKRWLKDALKSSLPEEFINRPKRGFEPPYGAWIEGLVKRYSDRVLDGEFIRSGYFKSSEVERLFRSFKNHYSIVYRLMVLEVWYQSVVSEYVVTAL